MNESFLVTEVFAVILMVLGVSVLIFIAGKLIFQSHPIESYILVFQISIICFLTFCGLWLMRKLLDQIHDCYGTRKVRRAKIQLLIGLGLIALAGWVPRVVMFFVDFSYIYHYTHYIYPTIIISTCVFFFSGNSYIGNNDKYSSVLVALTVTNYVPLVVFAYFAQSYPEKDGMIGASLGLTLFSVTSTIEFLSVLLGEAGWSKKGNPSNNDRRLDCRICRGGYSETKIPRILTQCGHTMCQDCIELFNCKGKYQEFFCLFCRVVTVVQGPASSLAKNHVVLECLKEISR